MSYLVDTCVCSHLRKKVPQSVKNWFEDKNEELFFLSVVTIAEIEDGIGRIEPSKKKTDLEDWFYGRFQDQFLGRILPIDEQVAKLWGRLNAKLTKIGIQIGVQDLYIACTALVHSFAVVTTNVKDFEPTGVIIINPWP